MHWLGPLIVMVAANTAAAPKSFSIKRRAGFSQPVRTLQLLAKEKGQQRVNHFCVVGYDVAGDEMQAWVHWREQRALILWEPTADASEPVVLSTSRRYLRLDEDVVPSEQDLEGSTYKVTQSWADKVLLDCRKRGDHFLIRRARKRAQN